MNKPITVSTKSISREITAQGDGGTILRVASFRGSVQPQRSVTVTVDISGAGAAADDYADEIRQFAEGFFSDVRQMAAQNGVPV